MENVVMVELDYKGEYERCLMTNEGFKNTFVSFPAPCEDGNAETIRPMVHIWYQVATSEDQIKTFLTDMAHELPQGDIDEGNLAVVDTECFSDSLKHYIDKYVTNDMRKIDFLRGE